MSAGVRAVRRCVATLALTVLAVGVFAPAAGAHGLLVRSDPAAGATLAEAPTQVRLWFSEDISPRLRSAELVDGDGRTVAGAHLVGDPGDPRLLVLEPPPLSTGTYGVLWRVLAEGDGHTTSGVLVFNVGAAGPASSIVAGSTDIAVPPMEPVLRWLAIGLLAGVVGGLGVSVVVLGRADQGGAYQRLAVTIRSAQRRVLTFASGCAAASLVVGVASLVYEAGHLAAPDRSATGAVTDLLTGSRWGYLWSARMGALVALVGVLLAMRLAAARPARRVGRTLPATAGALVLSVVTIHALGSHAASLDSGRGAAIVANALHVLTACLWLGALPALALALWPRGTGAHDRAALVRACRRPFSLLAATSVALVVVTGLYSAGRQVETVDGVVSTTYGHALLVKAALLLAVGGLGLLNSARLHGKRPPRSRALRRIAGDGAPSRRLVVVEACAGALLLLAAAVLSANPPARGPVLAAPPEATRTGGGSVDDLLVSVSVAPNRPGVNGFTVLAASSRRPAPMPIDGVELRLERGGASSLVALEEIEPGRYFATGTLEAAGAWRLTAVVQRGGERLEVSLDWPVAQSASPRLVPAPGRRLAPIVNALALVLLVGLLAVGVWRFSRARRRRRRLLVAISAPREEERIREVVS